MGTPGIPFSYSRTLYPRRKDLNELKGKLREKKTKISKRKNSKKIPRNIVPGTLKRILRERKKNIQVLILFYNLMIF
jgi:hypothetical protein